MKLLLDTQLLLWAAAKPDRVPKNARALMENPSNVLMFSPVSIWEVVIKHALGRPDFQVEPRRLRRGLLENGYAELAITGEHALAIGVLPSVHRDPFDRLLVGQALVEGLALLTTDAELAKYPGEIRLV